MLGYGPKTKMVLLAILIGHAASCKKSNTASEAKESKDANGQSRFGTIYYLVNNSPKEDDLKIFSEDKKNLDAWKEDGRRLIDLSGLRPGEVQDAIAEDRKNNPQVSATSVLIISGHGFADMVPEFGRLVGRPFLKLGVPKNPKKTKLLLADEPNLSIPEADEYTPLRNDDDFLIYKTSDYAKAYAEGMGEGIGGLVLDVCFAGYDIDEVVKNSRTFNIKFAVGSSGKEQMSHSVPRNKYSGALIGDLLAIGRNADSNLLETIGAQAKSGSPTLEDYITYRQTNPFAFTGDDVGHDKAKLWTQNISFAKRSDATVADMKQLSSLLMTPPPREKSQASHVPSVGLKELTEQVKGPNGSRLDAEPLEDNPFTYR